MAFYRTSCFVAVFCLFVLQLCTALQKRATDGKVAWHSVEKKHFCPDLKEILSCSSDFNLDEILKGLKGVKDMTEAFKMPFVDESMLEHGNLSVKCGKPFYDALCSETSPLCVADSNTDDNPALRNICEKTYDKCSYLASVETREKYIGACVPYLQRQYTDMTCKAISLQDLPEGGCERPTQKMPAFYVYLYTKQSKQAEVVGGYLNTINTVVNMFSTECVATIRNLMCMPVVCSDTDDTMVLLKNKLNDCKMATTCMDKATDNVSKDVPAIMKPAVEPMLEPIKTMIKGSCDSFMKALDNMINPASQKSATNSSSKFFLSPWVVVAIFFKYFY